MMNLIKSSFLRFIPKTLWNYLRERRIVYRHKQTASFCISLVSDYVLSSFSKEQIPIKALKRCESEKIIWQYWAQGFEDLPAVVKDCFDSVDKWGGEYTIIRLHDGNISEYIDFPNYIQAARSYMSRAYFSDLLRVCILSTYGGLWLDATVMLSGPIPAYVTENDYFLYQRDPDEKEKRYWKNVYAYYFGWARGFRVNMLSSVFYSKKGGELVSTLAGVMLYYWSLGNRSIPDYFFLQILYDVLVNDFSFFTKCKIVGDCKPHYLQQRINDPSFSIMNREEILSSISIHKLTYK